MPAKVRMVLATEMRSRWKKVEKLLGGVAVAAWLCAWAVFAYIAPSRRNPEPARDRVHAWANHGSFVYLSRSEDLTLKATIAAATVLFVCSVIVDLKFDPWERRRR
jgi:hypothetical protein